MSSESVCNDVDLLKALEAPLEDEEVTHHYQVTCEGEAVCFTEYCTRLVNNENVACCLIPHHDYMWEKSMEIEPEHMDVNARGKAGFQEIHLDDRSGRNRLCYFPRLVSIDGFFDSIRITRQEHQKSMIRFPHHLDKFVKDHMWSFEGKCRMEQFKGPAGSEMTVDVRAKHEKHYAKFNNSITSLNTSFNLLEDHPQIISR